MKTPTYTNIKTANELFENAYSISLKTWKEKGVILNYNNSICMELIRQNKIVPVISPEMRLIAISNSLLTYNTDKLQNLEIGNLLLRQYYETL